MKWQQTYKQASYQQSSLSMIKVCFLNAIQWLDFIRVSSAVSPDVLLWVVQHCTGHWCWPAQDLMGTLWVLYGFTSDTMGTSDQWAAVWPCAVKWVTLWPLVNTRTAAPCCRVCRSGAILWHLVPSWIPDEKHQFSHLSNIDWQMFHDT